MYNIRIQHLVFELCLLEKKEDEQNGDFHAWFSRPYSRLVELKRRFSNKTARDVAGYTWCRGAKYVISYLLSAHLIPTYAPTEPWGC